MTSDDELARIPYADLWLSELGATVPQHRAGQPATPRRRRNELERERAAPDPATGQPPA